MFVCNSEQKLLKSDSIYESYVRMKKGPVFSDSQCIKWCTDALRSFKVI